MSANLSNKPNSSPAPSNASSFLPSGVVTAMFSDMVGSTELKTLMTGQTSVEKDAAFRERIKDPHDKIVIHLVQQHRGQVVIPTGDGFFSCFNDPEEAVLCAVEIQEALLANPIETGTKYGKLQVKIGLNTGMAVPTKHDYSASTMDKAARIQNQAEAQSVLISRETHALVVNKLQGIDFERMDDVELKGLPRDTLYVVSRSGS